MKRRGEGLLALDPRTQMGLVITTTLVAFVPKPFWLEVATVVWLALLQALCGHPWMAVGYLAGFAAVIWLLDYAFAFEAAAFLGMFAFCFTLWRRTFAAVMAASLLAWENSVHRIVAAMRRLSVPEAVLVPFATGLRYLPTFRQEASHIRDAMRLRDVPLSEKAEAFVVPLMMSATTTADELSRAAVCRGIENPAPRADTERLHMGIADWAVLTVGLAVCLYTLFGGAR